MCQIDPIVCDDRTREAREEIEFLRFLSGDILFLFSGVAMFASAIPLKKTKKE